MESNKPIKPLKTEAVRTRLNPAEKVALQTYAKANGVSTSRVIQKMVRELVNQSPDLIPAEMVEFKTAVRELAAIGRNLNQLTRAVNSGKVPSRLLETTYWGDLQRHVDAINKQLYRYIDATQQRWVGDNTHG